MTPRPNLFNKSKFTFCIILSDLLGKKHEIEMYVFTIYILYNSTQYLRYNGTHF